MSKRLFLIIFTVTFFHTSPLLASDIHPLAPADTKSPQNTYRYFIDRMNEAYNANLHSSFTREDVEAIIFKALNCLDLSHIPRVNRERIGFETALLLKEVLDRVQTPPYQKVPDFAAVERSGIEKYVIPNTEIRIERVIDGTRMGEYLFSSDTVDRAREFYNRVKDLPYKPGASIGAYEELIFDPGSLVPKEILNQLPQWMTVRIRGQKVWQWMILFISLILVFIIIMMLNRMTRVKAGEEFEKSISWIIRKLINPLSILTFLLLLNYFVEEQISIIGPVWLAIKSILRIVAYIAAAWALLIFGKGAAEVFISSKNFQSKGIDANITRIVFRLVSIGIILVVLWHAFERMGVSLTALFASAGIAGMALAFAARETLANFFGGASILLDRPFKAGDYIILESGQRGEVLEVGLRSTRLLTRDDVQISIPNSTITNTMIINESAPRPHFRVRVKVGVAYGSDIEQVEAILLRLATGNRLVRKAPAPLVRLRGFGESSVNFELLCLTHRAADKGKLIHTLYWNIYKAFEEAGIVIPFPQRDVHIHGDASPVPVSS